MMVHCVELCSDVYQVCLTHALSTEKEEVMGLLMGEVNKPQIDDDYVLGVPCPKYLVIKGDYHCLYISLCYKCYILFC